jgi:hypothetical protein
MKKSFGSIWVLAVAQLAATTADANGLLYVTPDGEMILCADDGHAPAEARYVAKVHADADPLFIAARLKHVLRFLP